jgi:hypothetical protein
VDKLGAAQGDVSRKRTRIFDGDFGNIHGLKDAKGLRKRVKLFIRQLGQVELHGTIVCGGVIRPISPFVWRSILERKNAGPGVSAARRCGPNQARLPKRHGLSLTYAYGVPRVWVFPYPSIQCRLGDADVSRKGGDRKSFGQKLNGRLTKIRIVIGRAPRRQFRSGAFPWCQSGHFRSPYPHRRLLHSSGLAIDEAQYVGSVRSRYTTSVTTLLATIAWSRPVCSPAARAKCRILRDQPPIVGNRGTSRVLAELFVNVSATA